MEILACLSNPERNSIVSENQFLCPTHHALTYLLQRFMTIIVTFSGPGVHSGILFSCSKLMWNWLQWKLEMLERVWEEKSKIWSWFSSVFVENRYCPQGWHVRHKSARKTGDSQKGFACNMYTISRAQRRWGTRQALISCLCSLKVLKALAHTGESQRVRKLHEMHPGSLPLSPNCCRQWWGGNKGSVQELFQRAPAHAVT